MTLVRLHPGPEPDELELRDFLREVLGSIGRRERRRWAGEYVNGLLKNAEVGRKTIARLAEMRNCANSQALHHVVANSPWDWNEVLRRTAEVVMPEVEPERAWVLREVRLPKRGTDSVGVARARGGNVQIGYSLHYAGALGTLVLGWRLFLPHEWIEDAPRRHKAGIPEDVVFHGAEELALELIEQAREWKIPPAAVVGDLAVENGRALACALEQRGLSYVLKVPPALVRYAGSSGEWQRIRLKTGPPGNSAEARFRARRIRAPEEWGGAQELWLLEEQPASEGTVDCYLANLSEDYTVQRMAQLVCARLRVDAHVHELQTRLGLADFEGRNWRGWHHHVTLVAVAHAFRLNQVLRRRSEWLVKFD